MRWLGLAFTLAVIFPIASEASNTKTKSVPLFKQHISQCPQLPVRRDTPLSVHDLRPDDIRVIMSLGDSITAGFAARGLASGLQLLEDRGVSFSIGGDPGAFTLPNMLRFYVDRETTVNDTLAYPAPTPPSRFQWRRDEKESKLIGASTGQHMMHICYGSGCPNFKWFFYNSRRDNFNGALSGSTSMNLNFQLDYLIDRVNNDPKVNVTNDFKMLTLLIGANDACDEGCNYDPTTDTGKSIVRHFEARVRLAVERIRLELPKTIVNLVPLFNLHSLAQIEHHTFLCRWLTSRFCPCVFPRNKLLTNLYRQRTDALVSEYEQIMYRIAASYRLQYNPNFAVVVQPMFREIEIDQFDHDYISNFDCFHPSTEAHCSMARALWLNLFLRGREKKRSFDHANKAVYCPTAEDRIATF